MPPSLATFVGVLCLHLEDMVQLIDPLLLFDPVLFKNMRCVIVYQLDQYIQQKRPVFYIDCAAL